MTDAPVTAKQAEAAQESKDLALAKSMNRQPLARKPGESDFHYHRRLSRTLTEAQIQLAHDMHAVHSASASGFVLPPLPVTDEQKAADAAQAESLKVVPIEREPGETDAAFEARLKLSPPVESAGPLGGPGSIGGPMGATAAFPALLRSPGESDADYKVRNDANIARLERDRNQGMSAVTLQRNPGETDAAYNARLATNPNAPFPPPGPAPLAGASPLAFPPGPAPHALGGA
jgi:hypothetical protein